MANSSKTDFKWPALNIKNDAGNKAQRVLDLLSPLRHSDDDIKRMMAVYESQMIIGMDADPEKRKKGTVRMLLAHLPETLNGTETGDYLALDVGGTNFRVLLVKIRNGRKCGDSIIEFYDVPKELLVAAGEKMFEFLAQKTVEFMKKHCQEKLGSKQGVPSKLGFCFSFPMEHIDIRSAILLAWAANVKCSNTIGRDVTAILQEQLDKLNANVEVIANVNDVIGTQVAGSVEDPHTRLALILGTGINVSYIERVDRIPKLKRAPGQNEEEILMETDNGVLGDNGCIEWIRTKWDVLTDADTANPKTYMIEKIVGGGFICDIARYVLLDLLDAKLIFNKFDANVMKHALSVQGVLASKYISEILRQPTSAKPVDDWICLLLANEKSLTTEQIRQSITDDDREIIRYVCAIVSTRAAMVVGALLGRTLVHMNEPKTNPGAIAVTGSLFGKHPTMQRDIGSMISRFAPGYDNIRFVFVKDGSGEGAAYCAAVADRLSSQHKS